MNIPMEDAMMEGFEQGWGRDGQGRFMPGQSGNPVGKKPGTRNRATVLREALRDGEDVAAARIVKPSPSGRGLGEGACRTLGGAGKAAARRPHPDPLPKGEGKAWGERDADSPAFRLHFAAAGVPRNAPYSGQASSGGSPWASIMP